MNKIYKLEIDVEIKLLFYTICLVLIIGYGFMEWLSVALGIKSYIIIYSING